MSLTAEVLTSPEQLAPHLESWDRLAVICGRPYCAPAWMLAWSVHVAPKDSRLRVLAAVENGVLVGLAPFACDRLAPGVWRYRLLSSGTAAPVVPLALPDRQSEVGATLADALRKVEPRPSMIAFEGIERDSPWPTSLAQRRSGGAVRAQLYGRHGVLLPTLRAPDGYERWLASKSQGFRYQVRRAARTLHESGGRIRFTESAAELPRDLAEFERLHRARWDQRGGTHALVSGVDLMLAEAAPQLFASGRLRLAMVEVGERVIGAQLFIAAGDRLCWWLGGSDDEWSSCRPALLAILHALEDGIARGARLVELGPGDQLFKTRLADDATVLESGLLALRPSAYPLVRAYSLPGAARRRLAATLTPESRAGRAVRSAAEKLGRW
ncbi:MAG: GNAT family N-acetyltransferase [Solirubrobacteraceae bacterium]